MTARPTRLLLVLALSLAALSLAAISPAVQALQAQTLQITRSNRTIAVTTTDQATALADTAAVSVGFIAYGNTEAAANAEASRLSNAITNALTTLAVPKDAIQSVDQHLAPLTTYTEEDKARFNQGIRYTFAQSWTVTVPAPRAAVILNVSILAGANNSGNIQWSLKDDTALQTEANQKALTHARQLAIQFATGLHARLGGLVYASNVPPSGSGTSASTLAGETLATLGDEKKKTPTKPLAISPDRISRSATVYAVFAIATPTHH